MQVLSLDAPGRLRHYVAPDLSANDVAPGHALVRVHRVGVCGTDLHAYRGRQPFFTYPRILGHELGVEVIAVADNVVNLRPGDCCAVEPYLHCGRCVACRRDKPNCCANLRVLGVHQDGGLREWLHVPAHKLHRSTTLSFESLALVETLAIGAHAVARAALHPDDTVLIVGAGPIGLSVVEFVKLASAHYVVADREPARLAFCREQLGVSTTLLISDDTDVVAQLPPFFDNDLPTVVIDATGNPTAMMRAFDYVAPGGKLVYVGLFQGDVRFHDPTFHRKEITVLASRNALPVQFRTIIDLLEAGRIDTSPWITHRAPLSHVVAQFPTWLDPANGVVKAMITL